MLLAGRLHGDGGLRRVQLIRRLVGLADSFFQLRRRPVCLRKLQTGGRAVPGRLTLPEGDVYKRQVWNTVTINRAIGRSTWYFVDEFHLLLKEEQTAAYSAEIWKRFRKWGGIPTGATQNPKDLLSSPEIENILENSDFIYMLNQAAGDRKIDVYKRQLVHTLPTNFLPV